MRVVAAWPPSSKEKAQPMKDVADKLRAVQKRRKIADFCRRCKKPRTWFYKVLDGEASVLPFLAQLDAVFAAVSSHGVTAVREARGLSLTEAAERLGVSRQTLHKWEREPATADRVARISALSPKV